jgi:hypothetical protein
MSDIIQISEAVRDGILFLKEQRRLGKGAEIYRAKQYLKMAQLTGNQRNAQYWREVITACRRLNKMGEETEIIIAD